jgi:phage-related tail fiber protein
MVEDADDSSAATVVRRLVLSIADEENVDRPVDDEITIATRTPNATEAASWPHRTA